MVGRDYLMDEKDNNRVPGPDVNRIMRIKVPLIVVLAEKKMRLGEILNLTPGTVIEFEKNSEDLLELMVNNRAIAHGRAIKIHEDFGLRLTHVGSVKEIIRDLGT